MNDIGQLVQGRYELLELAGEGGMALVYRAVVRGAAGFQRSVALKRIREQLTASTDFVRMFIEEARVCSELSHGNIVQVHDFGVDHRGYYLIMEWVDGVHLGQCMDVLARSGEAMPWRQAAAIAAQVSSGLSAAHCRVDADGNVAPIIHRDVTPQNILLSVTGVAKLTDFGLARAMDRVSMTAPDVVKGKLSYLAPELVFGQQATVQTDLYSLGIVLWEMLAGERLFWGETASERVRKVREAEIPSLAKLQPALPAPLIAVVERALDYDPARRFESAEAMHDALMLSLGSQLVSARELAQLAMDTRVASGLPARSQRPPRRPSTPPPCNDVVMHKVVLVKAG
ncbi:MAG: serine/threonine protein kinase [Myxococcaceae bacterium]|nr:serine/threonine protein kinase [Myxococcaceae bacterium]